jgi:uncharacterized damage-inducible protein DinB
MHGLFADLYARLADLHGDIKAALDGLPPEALDWVPGPDMNSLTVLVMHTTGAERYWIGQMAGGDPVDRVRAEEFQAEALNASALVERLDETLAYCGGILESLTLEDLETVRAHNGKDYRAAWSLLHALEHTAVHVGHIQMIRQLWDQHS